ncbi:MAG TPA: hypothetical protein VIO14_00740 [Dehalococcoidia bacterium]
MDNDYGLDLEEILHTIDTEEVTTFRFVIVNQRLLIDTRCSEIEGPMIKLVPRARSAEERFRALKQLRPRFRLPERIVAIWWPKYVESLVTTGVWDRIEQRFAASGFPGAVDQCREVLRELRAMERTETVNAILGSGYQALWEGRK